MKRNILFILLFLIFCSVTAQERARLLNSRLFDATNSHVFVVAHRGDWRNTPENSLQAVLNCIDMGVDMVEIDLKMSKDSVLVLMHDKTIDRTTTGKGYPHEYTLEELKKLKLRNGAGHTTRHTIPTLEEVMIAANGKILVNIDKGYEYFQKVYEILVKTNTVNQCIIKSSFSYAQIKAEHQDLLDKVIFMPIIRLGNPDAMEIIREYIKEMPPVAIEVTWDERVKDVQPMLSLIKENGVRIWVNSLWPELCGGHDDDRAVEINEKDESWGWIVREVGATLIQTDRPAELIDYLKSLNDDVE